MSPRDPLLLQRRSTPEPVPAAGRVLRRTCDCGQHTVGGGECERCRGEGNRTPGAIPAIVHEVAGSPGRPLDAATRARMEAGFGGAPALSSAAAGTQKAARVGEPGDPHEREAERAARHVVDDGGSLGTAAPRADFSRVRVHTDARARASAQAVGARAYTLGSNVVFNAGEYAPEDPAGRHLLAHELAHVQQQRQGGGVVQRVGFFQSIARFFGGGTFGEEELQTYLAFLRENRTIEGDYDSDNKAREVVSRWKGGDAAFRILEIPVRVLLIKEMTSGFLSEADQNGILDLLTEAIPSERGTMLKEVDLAGLKRRFDDAQRKRLDALIEDQDVEELSLSDEWSLTGVQQILHRHGDESIIKTMIDKGLTVIRFETAYDKWRYDDGRVEEDELKGLEGNSAGTVIRLRKSLTNQNAAATLFHEVSHTTSPETEYLEEEIQVRVSEEHFRMRHGLPPSEPEYRKADGTVNEAAIRAEIGGSSHYNPTGRTRIGRRYEGEVPVTGWSLP